MPEDKQPPTAGFLGGAGLPEPEKPKQEKAAPTPPPPAQGDNASFMGNAGQPTPLPTTTPQAEASVLESPPQPAQDPEATMPAPAIPATPAEPPQPMPAPDAPAQEFFVRAEELFDQGFLDSAITAYRRGLEKDPNNSVAINNLAMVFIDKERYEDARDEIERAIQRGADNPELFFNLGHALRKLGRDHDAADSYEKYVDANPGSEDTKAIKQWILQVRATPSEEIPTQPAPAAQTAPSGGEAAAFITQADTAYDNEDFQSALELYEKASMLDFESSEALAGKGRCQAKLGLMEEGLASLREASAMAPQNSENHFIIGCILRNLAKDVEAADAFDKFLELEPNSEQAEMIGQWVAQVREANPAPTAAKESPEESGLKIEKQPAWAQALEGPPPGAEMAGLPQTEATMQQDASRGAEQLASIESSASEPSFGGLDAAPVLGGEATMPAGPLSQTPPVEQEQSEPTSPKPQPEESSFKIKGTEPKPTTESGPEQAPSGNLQTQLDEIQQLLADGDNQNGLTKAQQLVGQNPDCIEGKILIARCFGQRGEFPKAMAILENLVKSTPNDEAFFFLGRCQQETGKIKEAQASFQSCLDITENEQLRSRVQELLADGLSTSEMGVCSSCAQSKPNAELQDIDGKPVCVECRDRLEKAAGGPKAFAEAAAARKSAAGKPAKSAKISKVKKGGIAGKLVAALFLLILLAIGGMVGLYYAKPSLYQDIRSNLPTTWPLPSVDEPFIASNNVPVTDENTTNEGDNEDIGEGDENGPVPGESNTAPTETMAIQSPALEEVIAGVVYEHKVVAGGGGVKDVVYSAKWSREPIDKPKFDSATGELTWRPMPQDMKGEPIILTFGAKSGEKSAPEQQCRIKIRPPVIARKIGLTVPGLSPGMSCHIATGDLTGDKKDDILVVYGRYWSSKAILFKNEGEGKFSKAAELETLGGRPVGVAIGNFGNGKKYAAIVDYWNAKMRFLNFENGSLVISPQIVELPGRPTMAAFGNPDGKGGMGVAVLLPEEKSVQVYDCSTDGRLAPVRQFSTPEEIAWKSLHMLDLDRNEDNPWAELALVRLGKSQPSLYLVHLKGKSNKWAPCNIGEGLIQATASGDIGGEVLSPRPDITLASGTVENKLYTFLGNPKGKTKLDLPVRLGPGGPVIAMACADLDGNGAGDLLFLQKELLYMRLRSQQGKGLRLCILRLPSGTYPPLGPTATGEFTGDSSQDVVYIDREGNLSIVSTWEMK